ncbi:hypothetical protein B0H17DRAFT_1244002, partial [Mycena rosella]
MLVQNLVDSVTDEYDRYLSRFATGIISQIVAGHRITLDDDWYLQASNMVYEAMTRMGPPGMTHSDLSVLMVISVQYFPSWFPGTSHRGVVKRWRPTLRELHDYPMRTVKEQ